MQAGGTVRARVEDYAELRCDQLCPKPCALFPDGEIGEEGEQRRPIGVGGAGFSMGACGSRDEGEGQSEG